MMSLASRSFPLSKRSSRFKTLWIELGLRLNPFDAKLMRDNTLFKSFGAILVAAFRELAPIINTINSQHSSPTKLEAWDLLLMFFDSVL